MNVSAPQQDALIAQALNQEASARTSKEIGHLALRAIEAETRLALKTAEVDFLRQNDGGALSQLNQLVAAYAYRALAEPGYAKFAA